MLPKHGPGATAERISGNQKYNQYEWTERLETYFPFGEFAFNSWTSYLADPRVTYLDPGAERPVRVITVPKTLKAPRIIAIEPVCMQYTQQALLEIIEESVESHDTMRQIAGWKDQSLNQKLALQGSRDGSLATLDLSEASDRVSSLHVEALLSRFPHLKSAVFACRSTRADVLGHGIIPLTKFASMGSALCFPMEAMVFTTLVFMGIQKDLERPLTRRDIKSLSSQVRVYGDDIIVPVEFTSSVVHYLELFGLKVNSNKSFWTGLFRESCGKEYFSGHDVTTVKVRKLLPSQRKHASELISAVSLRNQFFLKGYEKVVETLDTHIERLIPFPYGDQESSGLVRYTDAPLKAERMCKNLHRPLIKAMVVHETLPIDNLEGYGALMKFFLKRGVTPFQQKDHLRRAGRPVSVDIKTRWIPLHK